MLISTFTHYRGDGEQLSTCGSSGPSNQVNCNSTSPIKNTYPNQSISPIKPGPLPANLNDLKVSCKVNIVFKVLLNCNNASSSAFSILGFGAQAALAYSWHACLWHQDSLDRATSSIQRHKRWLISLRLLWHCHSDLPSHTNWVPVLLPIAIILQCRVSGGLLPLPKHFVHPSHFSSVLWAVLQRVAPGQLQRHAHVLADAVCLAAISSPAWHGWWPWRRQHGQPGAESRGQWGHGWSGHWEGQDVGREAEDDWRIDMEAASGAETGGSTAVPWKAAVWDLIAPNVKHKVLLFTTFRLRSWRCSCTRGNAATLQHRSPSLSLHLTPPCITSNLQLWCVNTSTGLPSSRNPCPCPPAAHCLPQSKWRAPLEAAWTKWCTVVPPTLAWVGHSAWKLPRPLVAPPQCQPSLAHTAHRKTLPLGSQQKAPSLCLPIASTCCHLHWEEMVVPTPMAKSPTEHTPCCRYTAQ